MKSRENLNILLAGRALRTAAGQVVHYSGGGDERVRTPVTEKRLHILEWLKDPATHFPPQHHRDPRRDGVTADAIAKKLGVPRRTATTHLNLLKNLGLLHAKRIRWRTHYRRDETRIAEVEHLFKTGW